MTEIMSFLPVLYNSQGSVMIEESALHDSEPADKSEVSPLMNEKDGSSPKESQSVEDTSNPEVTNLY